MANQGLEKGGFSADVSTYDPATGKWADTLHAHETRLAYGNVALKRKGLGCLAASLEVTIRPSQRRNLRPGRWKLGKNRFAEDRTRAHAAALLDSGNVLVTGGVADRTNYPHMASFASAELYDPTTENWITTEPMALERYSHTATY